MTNELPILMVDFRAADRRRIIEMLRVVDMGCTDEQAEQLRQLVGVLPKQDHKLMNKLSHYCVVDWDQCPGKLEPTLRRLAADYQAGGELQRRVIELKMMAMTKGLDEHPEWWSYACLCDSCCSYST